MATIESRKKKERSFGQRKLYSGFVQLSSAKKKELATKVEDGVKEKGEEEQRQEDIGQMLITMTIVVFKVVALIFELFISVISE